MTNEEQEQVIEELDINKLIDKPLNELTPEEAEFVIEWKAERKLKEKQYQEAYALLKKDFEEKAAIEKALADEAHANLLELKEAALAFYNAQ